MGHLASKGDCLYATTIARQIKKDFPDCHLTWAIGSMSRSILNGNPDVDQVWEIPMKNRAEIEEAWHRFEAEALERKKWGEFDEIYLTQIYPGNLHNYDGGIRSSIFRAYPKAITVPVSPVIRLSQPEIENVRRFVESNIPGDKMQVILFECAPESGQSFVTPHFAIEVAEKFIAKVPDVAVILSTNKPFQSNDERIIDGSVLSFRENAELTKYCSLLVGCSSGISWLCTSEWAKPLPMVQLLKADAPFLASVVLDYEQWGLPTDNIIEIMECSSDKVVWCLTKIFSEGFYAAKREFHEKVLLTFKTHKNILSELLGQRKFLKAAHFCLCNIRHSGFYFELIRWFVLILKSKV